MADIRGKSYKSVAFDISEGYTAVNPLFLKPLDERTVKELYNVLQKFQADIRAERLPHGNMEAIRWRNLRLQRIYSATMIIKHYARERRIMLS